MFEITPENAPEYLRETRRVPAGRTVEVRALGWGVSNVVLRVDVEGAPSFVLKQARERLRVKAYWVSRLDRIWTEREALMLLDSVLPEGTVPRVLFSDEENYLFAMTCAPDDSAVWKEQLLAGKIDPSVGRQAGAILATIHRTTRDHPALGGGLADMTAFDELRIDPFYREIARVHPEIAPLIEELITSMKNVPHPSLVLGDFSPKNILVHSKGLTLVDFETAHAGDPAYDVGFFLSHLFLKRCSREMSRLALEDECELFDRQMSFTGLRAEFQAGYESENEWPRFGLHACACALARIDGKSPVDYLDGVSRAFFRTVFLHELKKSLRREIGTENADGGFF